MHLIGSVGSRACQVRPVRAGCLNCLAVVNSWWGKSTQKSVLHSGTQCELLTKGILLWPWKATSRWYYSAHLDPYPSYQKNQKNCSLCDSAHLEYTLKVARTLHLQTHKLTTRCWCHVLFFGPHKTPHQRASTCWLICWLKHNRHASQETFAMLQLGIIDVLILHIGFQNNLVYL